MKTDTERTRARQPQQKRAHARFESVLEASEQLLLEEGHTGFSIPTLAERLGFTRASIYKFFPTPYAVLNELLQRQLAQLEATLTRELEKMADRPWPELLRHLVDTASDFHNAHPLSSLLILGGPVSDDSYRAQEMNIQHLGALTRLLLHARGVNVPDSDPDVASLTIDLGTTCFRLSYFQHGEITPAYRDEAYHAMAGYLARYLPGAKEASLG